MREKPTTSRRKELLRIRLIEDKGALLRLRTELGLVNASAVGSLDEGFEETLTLHRFWVIDPQIWARRGGGCS